MNVTLEKQVILTLVYANYFSYPLSAEEVHLRLIYAFDNWQAQSFKKFSQQEILTVLKNLCQKKKLKKIQNYFYLTSFFKITQDKSRKDKFKLSQQKKESLKNLINFIKRIPFIEALALTGSMAVENVSSLDDDIDFLLVCQKNRLWLTRLIILIYALLQGKKVLFTDKQDWCFNIFLCSGDLEMSRKKQNLYLAYEVCQIKWLVDKNNLQKNFLEANSWVKSFLPYYYNNVFAPLSLSVGSSSQSKNYIFDMIDWLLYLVQTSYLHWKVKIKRQAMQKNRAFLHIYNYQTALFKVLKKYHYA